MYNLFDFVNMLLKIDQDKKLAGIIAGCIFGGVLVICVMALIFKKILLVRKYKQDEEYVKEYRKKLEEKERAEKKK